MINLLTFTLWTCRKDAGFVHFGARPFMLKSVFVVQERIPVCVHDMQTHKWIMPLISRPSICSLHIYTRHVLFLQQIWQKYLLARCSAHEYLRASSARGGETPGSWQSTVFTPAISGSSGNPPGISRHRVGQSDRLSASLSGADDLTASGKKRKNKHIDPHALRWLSDIFKISILSSCLSSANRGFCYLSVSRQQE